ncbi:MAG: sigma-54-dependent Fis family transcriptional regulator [Bacteroidales bacterium]
MDKQLNNYEKSFPDLEELKRRKTQDVELIKSSVSFMNSLYESIDGKDVYLVLTNEKGKILKVLGEGDRLRAHSQTRFAEGEFLTENYIGENAVSLAIFENKPIQHKAAALDGIMSRPMTCSAAPIHDFHGNVIGTLELAGFAVDIHPHSLGMVVAAARAIENRYENRHITKQLFESNQFAWSMMNNLSFGLFAIDLNDHIHWVNDTACRTLNIRRSYLIDKSIHELFSDFHKVREVILNNNTFQDEEFSFNLDDVQDKFLFSAYPIRTKEGEHHGILFSFRPYAKVLSLLNKFSVGRAWFTFDHLIGSSPALLNVIEKAKKVANSPSTVLINGPSGTGKEVFAQAIHNASDRRNQGFVAINCGAISPSLIESELFGYEDGAFTGARKGGHPGKFELADNGTLFLDEIGDMPMDMQVKLLRAIQDGMVTRVGGEKPTSVNVRIIAATHRNLEEEVKKGKFRLDLFYRLSVIPLKLPSLKERATDVPILARYFLKLKAHKLKKPIPELSSEIHEILLKYDWPGNIRELENFIEKVVNLDGTIEIDSETKARFVDTPESDYPHLANAQNNYVIKPLEDLEKDAITKAIKVLKGNVSKVAKALNISRNTLYLKMKKYNIEK